jgi:hypothetical protein
VKEPFSWPNSSLSSSSDGRAAQLTLTNGFRAPARSSVQFARDHFLADAAFSPQQDGHVAVGDAIHHFHDRRHRRTRAPVRLRALGIVGDLGAETGHLCRQRLAFERIPDGRLERGLADAVGVAGFQDVVGGAETDRLDNRRRRLAAGQHDDLRGGLSLADGAQRLDAVEVRHHHVEQNELRHPTGLEPFDERGAAVKDFEGIAARLQQRLR